MPLALALICAFWLGALASCADDPGAAPLVEVYKSPTCGCCTKWAEHLRAQGFRVETTDVADMNQLKRRHGVPPDAEACHTALVEGYVVEGHVPAADLQRLLAERPPILGLVVPGMPMGSPGMEGPVSEAYTVYAFDAQGRRSVFAQHD